MLGIRDPQLSRLVGLMFVPFGLQLVGWAQTPLGGGPCGAISPNRLLLEQPQAFFYAQIMLWGICLLVATGFFLIMMSFMGDGRIPKSQAKPFISIAAVLAFLTGLIYLLTHLTGLPTPSPIGWLMNPSEPFDVIGVAALVVLWGFAVLGVAWLYQTQPVLAPEQAQPHSR